MSGLPRPPLPRAPATAELPDGGVVDLDELAVSVCRSYAQVHPTEPGEYGEHWAGWCRHDTRYILAWAFADATSGTVTLGEQVLWLHRVLLSRGYPAHRLRDALVIAAGVVADAVAPPWATRTSELLYTVAREVPEA